MYYKYFGLVESPFSISVNPRYLFMSPRHRDALAHLLYGVGSGGGFILLTGEVGTGKTTINRALLEQLPGNVDLAIVLNPALSAVELLATVCDELAIDYPKEHHSLKDLTDALHRFLLGNHDKGRKTVLMIDEAQHLDFDVLEQIRLLTNLETDSEKLLQIILIGQPELTEKLGRPELRQLNQRITARYNLEALSLEETNAYIRHRLQVAGLPSGRELFAPGVVRAIHKRAQGIPRQINLLCDRALLGAYGRKLDRVNRRHVAAAAEEVFGTAHASVNRSSVRPWFWIVGGACFGGLLLLFALGFRAAPLPLPTTSVADDLGPAASVTAAELGADTGEDVSTGRGAQVAAWLINENLALEQLWQLNSDAPFPAGVCGGSESEAEVDGLRCLKGTAQVWDPVIALNRPVVLDMQTPGRFSAATLVVAFEGAVAWVLSDKGVERVRLVDMATAWRGHYRMFWQPPQGWGRPLVEGDVDPVITVVAQLFATLDQQATPLTEQRFTPALAERVRLFQAQQNLIADGVVGVQTLLKLNEALGIGLAPDVALRRAQWLTEGP